MRRKYRHLLLDAILLLAAMMLLGSSAGEFRSVLAFARESALDFEPPEEAAVLDEPSRIGRMAVPDIEWKIGRAVEAGRPASAGEPEPEWELFFPVVSGPATNLTERPVGDPVRLVIPSINLETRVVEAKSDWVTVRDNTYQVWRVPKMFAAGWHQGSASLGEPGNTVLNGHNNIYEAVFRDLADVAVGDLIEVYSDQHVYRYIVANTMLVPEKYEEIDTRMTNARWILPSEDERLTLVSCWPEDSNTHRVIVVARPLSVEPLPGVQGAQHR